MPPINPLTAIGVVFATAATDAVYVMFTSAVVARRRIPAATWSSAWYLLSSYAVISYTENWVYVAFAAAGSWIGAFASITFLQHPPAPPPPIGSAPR
jgi:predicted small integral membrane protein